MQRCELGRTNTLLMYFGRFFRHPLSTLQLVFSFLPWIYDPQLHYYVSLSAVLFPSAAGSCFQKNKFWLFKSFLRLFIISTGSKQSSLWVHAAVQFSPLLCVLGPPEEPAYTHLCALVDNNETNYSTGYSADWSMVWPFQPQMAPLLQHHLGFMFPYLTVFLLRSDGRKKSSRLRGEDLEAVRVSPNEESTEKKCSTYGRVTADLWVGLRSPLGEKYRWALSLVSGPRRLMAGRGLSLAPGVFGVETGLGWNGWEQQIMREICLRSNHWL